MKIINHRQAVLNDLSLQALLAASAVSRQDTQLRNARTNTAGHPPARHRGVPAVEITIGTEPVQLARQAIASVRQSDLQAFLTSVMAEPEVAQALFTLTASPVHGRAPFPSYPVQTLRRAAELASYWGGHGLEEKEVLFAATFIEGIGRLLAGSVGGTASLADILFTLVRPHLHRLDGNAPRHASLLRLALGWGNADEVDATYVPRLQSSVARALGAVRLLQVPMSAGRAH